MTRGQACYVEAMRRALAAACAVTALVGATARADDAAGTRGRGRIVKVDHQPPGDAPSLGPRYAPVTIEFFCDLSDRRSITLEELLSELAQRHPERLRVVYRLVSKRPRSIWQAEAAREAFAQGRFRELMDEFASRAGWPQRSDLADIAQRTGMNLARLERALSGEGDGRHAEAVVADYHRARRRRLSVLPGLLINGIPRPLSQWTIDELEAIYDDAYEEANVLLSDGVRLEDLYERQLREADAAVEYPTPLIAGAIDGASAGTESPRGDGELVTGHIDTAGRFSRGPDDAEVVLVFYCNLQTRNCKQMHDNIEELQAMFPDELRVVFKELHDPSDKRQPHAARLAQAALCADDQGELWRFYDEVFSGYIRRNLTDADILATGAKVGLDTARMEACLGRNVHAKDVETLRREAIETGVELTPSVVIGGRLYVGTRSTDILRDLVLMELRPGLLERLSE